MALLNLESIQKRLTEAIAKLAVGEGFELLSYKRNRGIAVIKHSDNLFWVRERGYDEQERLLNEDELQSFLKQVVKKEFPRSRKLRLYALTGAEQLERERKRL